RQPTWDTRVRLVAQTNGGDLVLADTLSPLRNGFGGNSANVVKASSYWDWLLRFEPQLFWPEDEISDRLASLPYNPLISIILPTYNTPPYFLRRCLQSVLDQKYANWQLCAADDCSSDGGVLTYLRTVADRDARINISEGASHGGISKASNRALENASGDFIVLLDHDDELHAFALLELVRRLNHGQSASLIYSDEDKIDVYGRRSQPAFKPGFDMDVLLSFDYVGHLIAVRRSVVMEIGGFRPVCDGSQDWDLLVRVVETIGSAAVSHIQKPLYHWRMHPESTALNIDAKPYVRRAWTRVISGHLERTGRQFTVENGMADGLTRLRPHAGPKNRVAVFTRIEDGDFQRAAIEVNMDRRCTAVYQINSCIVREIFEEQTANDTDCSLSSITEMNEDVFVFINRPLETINHFFFDELAGQSLRADCGIVTGIATDIAGKIVHSGFILGASGELVDPFAGLNYSEPTYMHQLNVVRSVEAISDHFFAVRREHLIAVGGLGSISSVQMPRLVHALMKHARGRGMNILVTPFALATFEDPGRLSDPQPMHHDNSPDIQLNRNLLAFEDLREVSRGRI
ncbi:MAG: glycosyltransferase, partial [Bryobacteraceae bacterium]